jgi:hypothetical protein
LFAPSLSAASSFAAGSNFSGCPWKRPDAYGMKMAAANAAPPAAATPSAMKIVTAEPSRSEDEAVAVLAHALRVGDEQDGEGADGARRDDTVDEDDRGGLLEVGRPGRAFPAALVEDRELNQMALRDGPTTLDEFMPGIGAWGGLPSGRLTLKPFSTMDVPSISFAI